MTGSSDAEINKNMKILKDSMEKQKKKEKKSNGKQIIQQTNIS